MTIKKYILLAVLIITICGAVFIYKEFNRTNSNIKDESSKFTVGASELINAFQENDSMATKKYVGNIISVKGFVKNIGKDERGYYTVSLGDTLSMSSVRCAVDSIYTSSAISVKPGTVISIKGSCTGFNKDELLGLDVIFNRCLIEH